LRVAEEILSRSLYLRIFMHTQQALVTQIGLHVMNSFKFVAATCAEAIATPFSHVRPLGDVKCRLITLFFPRPLTGYAIVIGRILIVRREVA
jgi:hypothetical protein